MSSLGDASTTPLVKAMLIGDSKSGKTSALVSLVEAGYKLYILDMDVKLVPSFFQQTLLKRNPKLLNNVEFEQPRDRYIPDPEKGGMKAAAATAYNKALNLSTKWSDGTNVGALGPSAIFVVDTLNLLSTAAFNQAVALSPGSKDARQWYKAAQNAIEAYLATLWSKEFNANVLVLSHVSDLPLAVEYIKGKDGTTQQQPKAGTETKGFPTTIGQALSKHVAKYSNELWTIEVKNAGTNVEKRVIRTASNQRMDLGTAALDLPKELPADTGLATLFERLSKL